MKKINMGCGWRNFGKEWIHIDGGDYKHLDYNCDISKKIPIEDCSIDLIYASHVLEYFDREQALEVLVEWRRLLKIGGVLRIAVPDFQAMANLYVSKGYCLKEFLGPLYGKMYMEKNIIYHKTTYDFDSLSEVLKNCNFNSVKRYDWKQTDHANFDDHSQAYKPNMDKEHGTLISLNVEAIK